MKFEKPLIEGALIKRYKRFFADVTLKDGKVVTAHCANSGSMLSVQEPGARQNSFVGSECHVCASSEPTLTVASSTT